jgi:fructose-bisphosphate aldolase class II/tagatose 1,6-diphosphate aldolase GatY/KbaY
MKLQSAKPMVDAARAGGYAVPALNTNGGTYDITRAALEAAQETRAPLILQVYEPNVAYRGFGFFVKQAAWLCDELDIDVPVALQVDHAHGVGSVAAAMEAGLTSVMIDASHLPFDENVRITREVLALARRHGVSVEAEIGYVKGNEPPATPQIGRVPVPTAPTVSPAKTTVEEAARFVAEVDVDMLAVSVGTTHGVYRTQTGIDFALLAALRQALRIPLVQHGTGGIVLDDLARLAREGMAKVNFGEPFRYNYIRYFSELTDEMEHLWHPGAS